ncbi:unnamed protein product [Arctogadus glacialis]
MDEKRGWRLREEGEREGEWKKGQGRKEKEAEEETNDGGEKVIIPADIQMFVVVFLPAQYLFSHIVCPSVRVSAACVGLLLICCSVLCELVDGWQFGKSLTLNCLASGTGASRLSTRTQAGCRHGMEGNPLPLNYPVLGRQAGAQAGTAAVPPISLSRRRGSSAVFATSVMNLWVSPTASTCAFRDV